MKELIEVEMQPINVNLNLKKKMKAFYASL